MSAPFVVPDVSGSLRTAVLGAGTMGRGIAQLLLQAGCAVTLIDPRAAALADAERQLKQVFEMLHGKGRNLEPPAELLARLETATELATAAGVDWLFEAAPEDLALKRRLFAEASEIAPMAVLATNTSTLSVTAIAAAAKRPEAVVGMHFFNPPGIMQLVEVVPGTLTLPTVVKAATELARRLGRQPVVAKDSPGFIVNRLARAYYLEALRLHASGVPVQQLDSLMRAAGFRQGPFELLDLIGLDVNLAASIGVYRAFFEEPRFRPHPLQQTMVTAGLLGRKSGRGFYRYDEQGAKTDPLTAVEQPAVAPTSSATSARALRLAVVGDNSAARQLLAMVAASAGGAVTVAASGSEADVIFDARLEPQLGERDSGVAGERARWLAQGADLAVLCWGHSASLLAGSLQASAYPGNLCGFSVVPGAPPETATVELFAPLMPDDSRGSGPAINALRTQLRSSGIETEIVPDAAGGVSFRVVALLANEAISALADGLAAAPQLDLAMRLGVNYPRGPLAWAEIIELPALRSALAGMHDEAPTGIYAPHGLLTKFAAAGVKTLGAGGSTEQLYEMEPRNEDYPTADGEDVDDS